MPLPQLEDNDTDKRQKRGREIIKDTAQRQLTSCRIKKADVLETVIFQDSNSPLSGLSTTIEYVDVSAPRCLCCSRMDRCDAHDGAAETESTLRRPNNLYGVISCIWLGYDY